MARQKLIRTFTMFAIATILSINVGCQTYFGGMTLPSGHYLDTGHEPQYFPVEPTFPLQRELSYQEETAGLLNNNRAPAPNGLNPVPPGGLPAPNAAPPR